MSDNQNNAVAVRPLKKWAVGANTINISPENVSILAGFDYRTAVKMNYDFLAHTFYISSLWSFCL